MRRALRVILPLLVVSLATPNPAKAYTLNSGFTESCHEWMTLDATAELLLVVDLDVVPVPEGTGWDGFIEGLEEPLRQINPEAADVFARDRRARFLVWSILLGVRHPDTLGHAVSDLNAVRRIHADPTPEGQYMHALRADEDDGVQGDLAAIEGTKAVLWAYYDEIAEAQARPMADQITSQRVFLDYYGQLPADVWLPVFILGQALHALQDSHSHALRSDDGNHILHVLNFVEAIDGDLNEPRDGIAHSGGMDDCRAPGVQPLVERARAVTLAATKIGVNRELWTKGLNACEGDEKDPTSCGWIEYLPACEAAIDAEDARAIARDCCTSDNNYCDSRWLPEVRKHPSGPYLKCEGQPWQRGAPHPSTTVVLLGLLLWMRRRAGRRQGTGMWLSFVLASVAPSSSAADAQESQTQATPAPITTAATGDAPLQHWMVAAETHASALSDTPNDSLLNITFGFGLRGGYRIDDHWLLLGFVEQNYWHRTDAATSVDAGVINASLGFELRYAEGLLSSGLGVGVSVLRFDAGLHEPGQTGLFFHARPLGVRWDFHKHFTLAFDPISLANAVPAVRTPRARSHQYRATLGLEAWF